MTKKEERQVTSRNRRSGNKVLLSAGDSTLAPQTHIYSTREALKEHHAKCRNCEATNPDCPDCNAMQEKYSRSAANVQKDNELQGNCTYRAKPFNWEDYLSEIPYELISHCSEEDYLCNECMNRVINRIIKRERAEHEEQLNQMDKTMQKEVTNMAIGKQKERERAEAAEKELRELRERPEISGVELYNLRQQKEEAEKKLAEHEVEKNKVVDIEKQFCTHSQIRKQLRTLAKEMKE